MEKVQIYIRYSNGKKVCFAAYTLFRCKGMKFISRARSLIGWLKRHAEDCTLEKQWENADRIIGTDFQAEEIDKTSDLIGSFYEQMAAKGIIHGKGEWYSVSHQEREKMFHDYLYQNQENTDGNLLVDIYGNDLGIVMVKYAFLDKYTDPNYPMGAWEYMGWEDSEWPCFPLYDSLIESYADRVAETMRDIGFIADTAQLMTPVETKVFMAADTSHYYVA